jgi:hypothetical protein
MSRPENAARLLESVEAAAWSVGGCLDVRWLVVFDGETVPESVDRVVSSCPAALCPAMPLPTARTGSVGGSLQRNLGIQAAEGDDFLCFLDDDNLVHPGYFPALANALRHRPSLGALVVGQAWSDGTRRLSAGPDRVRTGSIDTAQFVIRRSLVGPVRWRAHEYCADGRFTEEVYARDPSAWEFRDELLCWYNKLR